jgi:hypothetical protein
MDFGSESTIPFAIFLGQELPPGATAGYPKRGIDETPALARAADMHIWML